LAQACSAPPWLSRLRRKLTDAFAWECEHHSTAERLSATLDQVDDIGIVLLDSVRYTDPASNADYHLSLRGGGDHGLIRRLRAAE
jgi:hypothetical protein